MKSCLDDLPNGIILGKWCTKQDELPSSPTHEIFLVRAIYLKTGEIVHSFAMFMYDPVRLKIDFDEWRFICGATCYARFSSENEFNVIAWAKVKLK